MKNYAIKFTGLAALVSAQDLIEQDDVSADYKIFLRDQQEDVFLGILDHFQRTQPNSTLTEGEQFSAWTKSIFQNFYVRLPNIIELVQWAEDYPPPKHIPLKSATAFLSDFFRDTQRMQLQ